MSSYPVVHFEIVGSCNAKCSYCVTGKNAQPKGDIVSVDVFSKVLGKLLEYGLFDRGKSVLYLYNWGEPFLHPKFSELVRIINDYDFKYSISTNASRLPDCDGEMARNLDRLMFSMPGFSQESYDKMHGFDFEKIKNNITRAVRDLRANNREIKFVILYHMYQFNLHEMKECENFADSIGAVFSPYYAGMNNWWQIQSLLDGTMPFDELKIVSKDLFLYYFWERINMPPKNTCLFFDQYLMIDENANISPCCALPTNHQDYSCGNILKDDIGQILKSKVSMPVCKDCMRSGTVNLMNNMALPKFYRFNYHSKPVGIFSRMKNVAINLLKS